MIDNTYAKRFWLFSFEKYYAKGAMMDLDQGFNTLAEVYSYMKNSPEYAYKDCVQIFDSKEKKVIEHELCDGKVHE